MNIEGGRKSHKRGRERVAAGTSQDGGSATDGRQTKTIGTADAMPEKIGTHPRLASMKQREGASSREKGRTAKSSRGRPDGGRGVHSERGTREIFSGEARDAVLTTWTLIGQKKKRMYRGI